MAGVKVEIGQGMHPQLRWAAPEGERRAVQSTTRGMSSRQRVLHRGGIHCDDNLERLAKLPSESVDLIYLDAPARTRDTS